MDASEFRRLADLAKLRFSADQEERAGAQIDRLLEAFAILGDANTDDVEPSPYPLELEHRSRPDLPGPCLTPEDVVANAPEHRGGCFRVPRVVEG